MINTSARPVYAYDAMLESGDHVKLCRACLQSALKVGEEGYKRSSSSAHYEEEVLEFNRIRMPGGNCEYCDKHLNHNYAND